MSVLGVDLSPWRASASFRRLYVAGFVTTLGGQATYVTVPFQLKALTNSPLVVGTLGLVELVPIVVLGLWGGLLADRVDRRRLIVILEASTLVAIGGLVVNALVPSPQVWALYVADVAVVGIGALQQPSIGALNQTYVSHDLQQAAAALATIRQTAASILGPALGGLAAVAFGPAVAYEVNLVTLALSLALLVTLAPSPPRGDRSTSSGAALREGVAYVRSRPDLLGTYTIDVLAMVLAYPVVMLPFVAADFHRTYALALLYCALPIGALLATVTSRWTHRVHHYGRAVVGAAGVWGLGVALFGATSSLWWAMIGLIVGGGADAVSGIFRTTMWNESIPLEVRGRMAGIELISYSVGPTGGQFRAGAMARWVGLRASLSLGGLACTGSVAAAAVGLRALWRFDARRDVHVAALRASRAASSE